jgi:LacI family transcriptional regulator
MFRKITLRDVAQRAGVRYRTVSKILRNQIRVTPDVRQRILTVVKQPGHRPNVAALDFRSQSSRLIGYFWESWRQNFFNPLLEQCQQCMAEPSKQPGYHIPPFPHCPGTSLAETYRDRVFTGWVDGIILSSPGYHDPDIRIFHPYRRFRNRNVPTLATLVGGDGQPSFFR